ncbi:MAG: multifunctional oxoglutarate decarboxylase/oxoglutarate dehydrogenase thiamine pyrophosphate-binding subunit/dihydrolipoyllysine-residue succinyltransferase subunit [Bacteroidetes bacterium]|nr:multifunctional oxoglutarate decarboxylase/oxoglutarate dehydrogenase thiamine pyrophosphate-binding subunit/dihydrolipoyllysine-residue succinyltransferase subunit [Bacteroidota bacterium]
MSNLGFNTGYIEELYRQYLENPDSVSESWKEFFLDYRPDQGFVAGTTTRAAAETPSPKTTAAPVKESAVAPERMPVWAEEVPIRGAGAAIVENMVASLGVPTATSVRTVPVKLMAENRTLINDFQRLVGGNKVSFTHIIAWAMVKALKIYPSLNTTYRYSEDGHLHVVPHAVNLGLAIDVERRGKRTLLVPNIKSADQLNFAQILGTYNDLVRRARDGKLEVADFQQTTATLTNPGMIGTNLSVPRLMDGQGVIVGVGSIGYPTEYYAFPPEMISKTGISQIMTLTSTYDHRVIQGAESGGFLAHIEELVRGEHGFYDEIFRDLKIPYQPWTLATDSTPQVGALGAIAEFDFVQKEASVLQLIRSFRVRGHLQADVNPLGYDWEYHPELDPASYGLTIWDLDREFVTGGLGGKNLLPLRTILDILRRAYTRQIGVEFMHISSPEEKEWISSRIEPNGKEFTITEDEKRRMLEKLNAAEAFETFLHTKYIGHKRFSLEGSETIIPMLDRILSDAAEKGVHEVVMGMAHRGRLNLLANIMNKPYEHIFSEFEGNIDPKTTQGSGDVKYHLGASSTHSAPDGRTVGISLSSNPSHLEAVSPVVEGMVRAKQEARRHSLDNPDNDYMDSVIPILIHGDAAFAGQGVVAETLHLSQLPGYRTGGTIHIVINNQIGFTTGRLDARSSTYATDSARMIQAPIFHVNGDDPEACMQVARLALEYRQAFNKDVVIDMLSYRVRGHNEGDEPTYTQPLLYHKIEDKRSPRKMYTELLLRRGHMTPEHAEHMLDDFRNRLQDAFDRTKELSEKAKPSPDQLLKPKVLRSLPKVATAASEEHLAQVVHALNKLPESFAIHKKLERQFTRRDKLYFEEKRIDWGFAEALAFGTILLEKIKVRVSGQDSRRGTFSHRHAVLYDQENGNEYIPLNHIEAGQEHLSIYDSLLSEYAVCGFEYGYSVSQPDALVIWEAQFGDFANGAQIIFDQFLSAAEEKWGQKSSLVLLLPHGFEGQGPEHSSARLERFLQLCAENNMIVCSFSTPAQLFHGLRRQASPEIRKPLVVMAPKSLLRHPSVVSTPEELFGGVFQEVIPSADAPTAKRLVFCSGKLYYDLMQEIEQNGQAGTVAVCRLEQFYPFPSEQVVAELDRFAGITDVVWAQEEPANMGAWQFVRDFFDAAFAASKTKASKIRYIGREASASTSTGSAYVHQAEQSAILKELVSL